MPAKERLKVKVRVGAISRAKSKWISKENEEDMYIFFPQWRATNNREQTYSTFEHIPSIVHSTYSPCPTTPSTVKAAKIINSIIL